MKQDVLLSAGIDIGTTTTHLIFSRIGICLTEAYGSAPKAEITDKQILFRSPIFRTPLTPDGQIDAERVRDLIASAFHEARIAPGQPDSGAVIITGESAKKRNAPAVLQALADYAGDFVSASAGSELESYLSGKGAEADRLAVRLGKSVANVDVGGGTTNLCLFAPDGVRRADACLELGGRMLAFGEGNRLCATGVARTLLGACGVDCDALLAGAETPDAPSAALVDAAERLSRRAASLILGALHLGPDAPTAPLFTDHPLDAPAPETVLLSGGVTACLGCQTPDFAYRDIGKFLARALREQLEGCGIPYRVAPDPIRATVIGAGQFSLEVSGTTIGYAHLQFPLKNLSCVTRLDALDGGRACAYCPPLQQAPDFPALQEMAYAIAQKALAIGLSPLVVVLQPDFSKALSVMLRALLPPQYPLLCLDGIACSEGDCIDIGTPVAGGMAVPVCVKTLVFGGAHA